MPPLSVLVLDLDGTTVPLVTNYGGKLSPVVRDAVRRAIDRGVHVSIATGRPMNLALPLLQELGIKDPCMFCDGAVIYNPSTDTYIDTHLISPEKIHEVAGIVGKKSLPFFRVQTMGNEVSYADLEDNNQYATGVVLTGAPVKEFERIHDALSKDPSLSARKISKTWDGGTLIMITDTKATKQIAIAHLMEYFDVTADQIVAVGDSENDIPMILAAGVGVAMGNAPEELKAIVEYVAPSVEQDGVADVIEKFFPAQ